MRFRLVACSITARTWAWVPSSRSTVKKSHARIASAWQRRNCGQVGPVRRGAGPMPWVLRISHTVDAATLTPQAGQFPVDPAVAPSVEMLSSTFPVLCGTGNYVEPGG